MADNPYQPPQATVADPISDVNNILVEPKKLPAGRGWNWIVEAFKKYFMADPGIWIVNIIILMVLMMLLAFIPILGGLAANILAPIFTAGLMLGCAAQARGEPLTIAHLFEGFKNNAGKLAAVGALYMLGMIIVMLIIFALITVFGGGASMLATMGNMQPGVTPSADQMQSFASMGTIGMLLGLALIIPIFMAYYFAPALIIHHDLGAIEAMKLSFKGCIRNIVPFLVYGIIAFVLAFVASIPFFLGWLVLAPVLTAVLYVSYKEIFTEQD